MILLKNGTVVPEEVFRKQYPEAVFKFGSVALYKEQMTEEDWMTFALAKQLSEANAVLEDLGVKVPKMPPLVVAAMEKWGF